MSIFSGLQVAGPSAPKGSKTWRPIATTVSCLCSVPSNT